MTIAERIRNPRPGVIEYPDSDGKPMAESDIHRINATQTIDGMMIYLRDHPDGYVSGNNFIFYEEGNPKKSVSPDAYVVFGVPSHIRRTFKVWEEGGHVPDVVFEFTSRKTRREDDRIKYPLYEKVLKVKEYFRFDPEGEYLKPRLQGFRLNAGAYEPLEMKNGRLHSEVLGLELVVEGEYLRLFDPLKQELLPIYEETVNRARYEAEERRRAERLAQREAQDRQRAEQRAKEQQQRAEQAEAEIGRMREELEALRRKVQRE
ncbi:MAG TPA: Uma2 family endonuclease [Armatimonadota bacterium]|nr:Uma2 family endonuclease [Armatimonadota bacterium]